MPLVYKMDNECEQVYAGFIMGTVQDLEWAKHYATFFMWGFYGGTANTVSKSQFWYMEEATLTWVKLK